MIDASGFPSGGMPVLQSTKTGGVTIDGGTTTGSAPLLDLTQTWNDAATAFTGIKTNTTATASAATSLLADLQVGGTSYFKVGKDGAIGFANGYSIEKHPTRIGIAFKSTALRLFVNGDGVTVGTGLYFGWASGNEPSDQTADLLVFRDAANIMAQRRTTNAQIFRVYNTITDASNYERLSIGWSGNVCTIAPEALGTGTVRNLVVGAPTTTVNITTLKSGVPVTPVTTTAAPASTDTGTVYTNEGDADGAAVTLPTAVAGLVFTAYVQTAQILTITANTGDTIRIASSVTAAAGSITSSTVGSSVVLQAINATEWIALSSVGSWSF